MKRLVKSRKPKISCTNCGDIITVNTSRIIENGLHRHFMCKVNKTKTIKQDNKMNHKKVIEQWYEIGFSSSHRYLGAKLDEFLKGSPDLDEDEDRANELWSENHTVLRDFDGDFEGIHIYHSELTKDLIKFICGKIKVDYESVKDLDFKLVG